VYRTAPRAAKHGPAAAALVGWALRRIPLTRESFQRLLLRVLAASFAGVGATFLLAPDATVRFMNAVGARLGDFTPAPASELRFWLSLGVAYMALVTALAALAQRDLQRYRPLLPLLALGKATSSLTCLAFYWLSTDAFLYLANFVVDGSIALATLWIWADVGLREASAAALSPGEQGILRSALEAAVPPGGPSPRSAADPDVEDAVRAFCAEARFRWLGAALRLLDVSPFLVPPFRLRRFSRLPLAERVRLLEAHEASALPPRRQAVHAFKTVAMLAFYSRPDVEAALGYPHPLERVPR
jgi:hypothetical protein